MTWEQLRHKINLAIERKGLNHSQVNVNFIWFSGDATNNLKRRILISVKKRKKPENGITHDLIVD